MKLEFDATIVIELPRNASSKSGSWQKLYFFYPHPRRKQLWKLKLGRERPVFPGAFKLWIPNMLRKLEKIVES
jgi:hypothetical protein